MRADYRHSPVEDLSMTKPARTGVITSAILTGILGLLALRFILYKRQPHPAAADNDAQSVGITTAPFREKYYA
jgi:hypothetical protein